MGWVGVATLIATACYLLYRYPPASWTPDSPVPQPQSEPTSDEPQPPSLRADDVKSPPKAPEPDEPTEESQSTPKASASSGAPSLEIPTFNLDADKPSTTEKPSLSQPQNGSAAPPATIVAPPVSSSPSTSLMLPPSAPVPRLQPNTSSSLMPPPPPPRQRPPQSQQPQPQPGRLPPRPNTNNSLRPPPSAASSLRAPPNSSGLRPPTSLAPAKLTAKPSTSSKRAVLEPGFSPLDWAALTSNPNHQLRGANAPPGLLRITPSMLKTQNGRKGRDAWTSYQGKVYNITPYVPFHPGGRGELLRGAGKDSAQLFFEVHPWVNWDAILGECLVGILVSENEGENALDAMD